MIVKITMTSRILALGRDMQGWRERCWVRGWTRNRVSKKAI